MSSSSQTSPTVVAYCKSWCSDCTRSKALLDRLGLAFTEFDVETSPGALEAMLALNGDRNRVPTLWIDGKIVLVEPSDAELAAALGRAGED